MVRAALIRHASRTARLALGGLMLLSIAVAVGLGCLGWLYASECRAPRLIALMYHRFVTADEFRQLHGPERIYAIPLERFKEQLGWLRDGGYKPVSLAEAIRFARGEADLPERAVLITIDDGCRSVRTRAEPLLRKYGFRAALFITTDPSAHVFDAHRRDQSRMSDAEIGLLDPAVFDVGAHGVTHRHLRDLPDGELTAELRESRATLERLTGRPCRAMAVPGNWYSERVLRFAGQAGYEAVFTSDSGAVRAGADPRRLRRVAVAGYGSLRRFSTCMEPFGIAKRRLTAAMRRFVGRRLWTPMEAVVVEILPTDVLAFYLTAAGTMIVPVLWLVWWRRRKGAMRNQPSAG